MSGFANAGAGAIVREIAAVIVANKAYLSEIDGRIGDGDHGNNMAKGFGRAAERVADGDTLDAGFSKLSDVLMSEIGGSMGPLYGMMFDDMASAIAGQDTVDAEAFGAMLAAGRDGVMAIGEAQVGDKTLLDTLCPAVDAFAGTAGEFAAKLEAMKSAAAEGRDATKDMVARVGRSSRLGERSRGVLDAGATSCCMILTALADGVARRLG
ncbi:dihydroxyacetone kinase subunit DhaL [Histidinibacterium lentulum]|uniref:Dihydroxyacetone kinase subunit L n=1 Tax=Histidinibacterium lentulum TaxID=2480588 RepID=A0A3N2R6C9_9RHOB|nr:dihydroxyacetone kinase subunit DhaL [Histidinibacterium lentulum]ROU02931.1 dihydroxyacetone kinase subunit L [Histidinibacterium lentulum]